MVALAEQTLDSEDNGGGAVLLWILVWSELVAFGLLLGAFLVVSLIQAEAFSAAREHLSTPLAGLNTMVLLTSGYCAALAAREVSKPSRVRTLLIIAAIFGLVFAAIKLYEYSGEMDFAFSQTYGSFFELYFLITGFHLVHVVFGSLILLLIACKPHPGNVLLITTLWHAIDLIWVLMFPLVYLV